MKHEPQPINQQSQHVYLQKYYTEEVEIQLFVHK